jgi:hypothetical protein
LNWLRAGAGAKVLAELASGQLACSHLALDAHPQRQAADYLRHVLVANGVLPDRDEALATTADFLTDTLAGITDDHDRRLVHTYATWRVLRRLRRSAEQAGRPRTYTRHSRMNITAAVRLLDWLAQRGISLARAGQRDIDTWLTGGSAAYHARDFLLWATNAGHAHDLSIPALSHATGPAVSADQRWAQLDMLLHDSNIDLTDRVAGALLLLYGQPLSRITALTTGQVETHGEQVTIRFGRADVDVPEPLAGLLRDLVRQGRRYRGVGSPATTCWLFPGLHPGRPLTAARLGERLRAIGVSAQHGRRAALMQLAAQLPAAVLAELLGLHPNTAVRWVSQAGGDWTRYAAELAQSGHHKP